MLLRRIVPGLLIKLLKTAIYYVKYRKILPWSSNIAINTVFEDKIIVGRDTELANSFVGRGTYIGADCRFIRTRIGKFCSIGNGVKTRFGIHPTKTYVSTHPAFYSPLAQAGFTYVTQQKLEEHRYAYRGEGYYVEIGNDVWIADDVRILDGVNVGDGAVIGLGSIVTKDVEPYSINVGIPAKRIGYRFDADVVEKLLKIKWWELDETWLRKNSSKFESVEEFIRHFE